MKAAPLVRDLILVGASMGGVQALGRLAAQLPADLPAAVLVVQHTGANAPGRLHEALARQGPLPAARAEDGMQVEPGHLYVAPPDRHLLFSDARLHVVRGPRENRSRPAIDPLFRTAAVAGRSRVIGVILTGLLGDGASGLRSVKRCGGVAVVQSDAVYDEMPRQAMEATDVDHQVPLSELGTLLAELAGTPAPEPPPVPEDVALEARLTHRAMTSGADWLDLPGHPTIYTCPECGGTLNEINDAHLRRYRCHTGHAFSEAALLEGQAHVAEEALWAALRVMEERAAMLERMARQHKQDGVFMSRAQEARSHAAAIRKLLQ